ncbi:3'(2'),5'-bisphosphate nucleotidase CysQ [Xanthomonas massiliensis]|uniref:3'(2'),5'-bisphosphate nucleotidase CysQ n=1 Tax=Xanthomonas massiliensis TaxID=1720302 RepID=UPI00082677EB|nr:3'(2'),5'-bisphosphate nucleotidase CysQ [Xanthomonas massiliensis]
MIRITPDLCETVIAIAREAGQAILDVYRTPFEVEYKADHSPVTAGDRNANKVILDALARLTPDLPIVSEESAKQPWEVRRHWSSYWLIDPLDGTREFVRRSDQFSVNIALVHQGAPVFAVIQSPVEDCLWYAIRGEQACRRDGQKDTVLRTRIPATAPLRVTTSRTAHGVQTDAMIANMGQVQRLPEGSSLKYCRIAQGDADVYPRFGATCEWDTAAGQCILQAAGGTVLALETGKPFRYNRRPTLVNGAFIALGDPGLPWRDWLPAP